MTLKNKLGDRFQILAALEFHKVQPGDLRNRFSPHCPPATALRAESKSLLKQAGKGF
ncbi:MAG: hypothetical protein NW224_14820 [Leptolyngbyaceae cyanobacterium bins.302]|nr:hypothetical protein [Leptolyngbyaceae cyanobacterium bins.302]